MPMTFTKITQILDHIGSLLSSIPGSLFIDDPARVTNEQNGVVIALEWAEASEKSFNREEINVCKAVEILPIIITIQCPRQIDQPEPLWRLLDPWWQLVHSAMYGDRTLGGLASPLPSGMGPGGVVFRGQAPQSQPTIARLIMVYDVGVRTGHMNLTE